MRGVHPKQASLELHQLSSFAVGTGERTPRLCTPAGARLGRHAPRQVLDGVAMIGVSSHAASANTVADDGARSGLRRPYSVFGRITTSGATERPENSGTASSRANAAATTSPRSSPSTNTWSSVPTNAVSAGHLGHADPDTAVEVAATDTPATRDSVRSDQPLRSRSASRTAMTSRSNRPRPSRTDRRGHRTRGRPASKPTRHRAEDLEAGPTTSPDHRGAPSPPAESRTRADVLFGEPIHSLMSGAPSGPGDHRETATARLLSRLRDRAPRLRQPPTRVAPPWAAAGGPDATRTPRP